MTEQSSPSNRYLPWVFFGGIFLFFCVVGRIEIPWAHRFLDPLAVRDTGTMLPYLLSRPNPFRAVLLAVLGHVEGPLQYILLTGYSFAMDYVFPLSPGTMQFPNTVFAFLACVVAFLLGRDFFGRRAGYCFALAFAMSPWLAHVIRMPWYFNTLACLFQFCCVYYLLAFMRDPESRVARVAFPVSLLAYLLVGLDWPSFLGTLLIFCLLSGKMGAVIRNPFNAIPALYGLVLLLWGGLLYAYLGHEGLKTSRMVYPFKELLLLVQGVSWHRVWQHTLVPWGPQLPLAVAGIVTYLFHTRKGSEPDRPRRSFLDATCVWLVVGSIPLILSSGAPSYVYVLGVPSAIMAGLVLARLHAALVVVCLLSMIAAQIYVVTEGTLSVDPRRRILAAACFLVEQRPDLLTEGKKLVATGMLPDQRFGDGMAVAQYTRGRNPKINLHVDWPTSQREYGNKADYRAVKEFVQTYNDRGKILADWIILESEAYSESNSSREFFQRLLHDPNVRWLGRFREKNGQEISIGEVVERGAVSWDKAPLMDVDALSETYRSKYDRMDFLKNNVEFVKHY